MAVRLCQGAPPPLSQPQKISFDKNGFIVQKDGMANFTPDPLEKKLEWEFARAREIERELAHMASFAEISPNAIIETDVEGHVRYSNPASQAAFPDLLSLGRRHPILEDLGSTVLLMRRKKKTLMTRPIRIGKKVYEQQLSLEPDTPWIRIYMSDITKLEEIDRLKSEFVSTVSHELRTPLTSIKAAVRMVSEGLHGATTPEQKEVLSMALANIERLNRLINDLLDISKIEAGKLDIHWERVDLVPPIRELCRSFEPLARQRGLEMRFSANRARMELFVDRDKILQVMTNLVQNAIKFTEKGSIQIMLSAQDHELQCTVADAGPGIRPEDLPKVFGKFEQFGQKSLTGERGAGLGLSLCKGLVELHGGRIWVESRIQEGSRFQFVLPVVQAVDLFKRCSRRYFDEAVAEGKPLSLLRFSMKDWGAVQEKLGSDKAAALLDRFETLVKAYLRSGSDFFIKDSGTIWVALPSAHKEDGLQVAERVEQSFRDFSFQQTAMIPVDLEIKTAGYPDDGAVAEQLLAAVA